MENNKENSEKREPITLKPQSVTSRSVVSLAGFWVLANFAQAWLKDAIKEALVKKNRDSLRREIVFSVCFVESYLVEWLRDGVFKKNIEIILQYPPINQRKGISKKLKMVLKDLHSKKLIPNKPDFNQTYWEEWIELVDFRNGLVHALSSLPDSGSVKNRKKPIASPSELSKLSPGWAAKTAINLVKKLHEFAGTSAPDWVIKNEKKLSK